jgi:hypothetical protein
MNKKRLEPLKKIDIGAIAIGEEIEIYAGRLASFKASVSRYNKDNGLAFRFDYSDVHNNYVTATRVTDKIVTLQP